MKSTLKCLGQNDIKCNNSSTHKQSIDLQPERIGSTQLIGTARSVLEAVKIAFENPEVRDDYEKWLVERRKRIAANVR